jgi:hypothetical protein
LFRAIGALPKVVERDASGFWDEMAAAAETDEPPPEPPAPAGSGPEAAATDDDEPGAGDDPRGREASSPAGDRPLFDEGEAQFEPRFPDGPGSALTTPVDSAPERPGSDGDRDHFPDGPRTESVMAGQAEQGGAVRPRAAAFEKPPEGQALWWQARPSAGPARLDRPGDWTVVGIPPAARGRAAPVPNPGDRPDAPSRCPPPDGDRDRDSTGLRDPP